MNINLNSTRFPNSFYSKKGKGFPVILLHGFGEDARIWKYQVEALSSHYTCIVPDLPGSGHSDLPLEVMSIELLAEFVLEILLQEKIASCILLGHSMGGYISLAFAEKYPEYLLGFGLVHSTAFADDEAKKENRRKSIQLIQKNGTDFFLKAMIPNLYSEQSRITHKDEIEFHLKMALEISSESLCAYYQAMIDRVDRTSVLKSFEQPILFVFGTEDIAVPLNQGIEMSHMPAISQLEILEDIGHTGMLETYKKVNSILNSFCKYVLDMKNR